MEQPYWLPVRGRSMYPLLQEEDLVYVHPCTGTSLLPAPGTLVLIAHDNIPVVHRYLGLRDGNPHEGGDHAGIASPFQPEDLLGVVTARKRNGAVKTLKPGLRWRLKTLFKGRRRA